MLCDVGSQGQRWPAHGWWRPYKFPPGASLLPTASRPCDSWFAATSSTIFLPVTHIKSTARHPGAYYYLATGCSDLHLRAEYSRMVVAANRLEAYLRLSARAIRGKELLQACPSSRLPCASRPRAALSLLSRHIAQTLAEEVSSASSGGKVERGRRATTRGRIPLRVCALTPAGFVDQSLRFNACAVSQPTNHDACLHRETSSWKHVSDEALHRMMRRAGVDTVVMLFQAPGNSRAHDHTQPLPWKTEIFRRHGVDSDSFYDARKRACALRWHQIRIPWRLSNGSVWRFQTHECAFCEGTPLTMKACQRPIATASQV